MISQLSERRLNRLHRVSQQVILENQQPGGGYLACPTMPDYQFSWFRDGAFIAYAQALDGKYFPMPRAQWDSANLFHDWCAKQILNRRDALERTITAVSQGESFDLKDTLNARYTVDGQSGPDSWPEFQLDGPGLWIWALAGYTQLSRIRPLPVSWQEAVDLTVRYLSAVWNTPCYDCWEERGTDVHISTLGAIYAGLNAAERLIPELNTADVRGRIHAFVLEHGLTPNGELAKSVGIDMVDANLLLMALPDDGMFSPDDPLVLRTVARIERDLLAENHGLHRHLEDTYYGGGAWVLLGLWLAWYKQQIGDTAAADRLIGWAEAHADEAGYLPEQVKDAMLAPHRYAEWVELRGEIARPLVWTHAMYILTRIGRQDPP